MKRLPEHTQVDDLTLLRRLAKKPEQQQVGSGFGVCQKLPKGDGMLGEVIEAKGDPGEEWVFGAK